jgi:hypothetical protein
MYEGAGWQLQSAPIKTWIEDVGRRDEGQPGCAGGLVGV